MLDLTNCCIHVYFLVQNDQLYIFQWPLFICPPGGARRLPWLHFETKIFLYYQHNFEPFILNLDYLWPLEITGQAVLVLYAVKGLSVI